MTTGSDDPLDRPTELTDSDVNEALEEGNLDEADLRRGKVRHRDEPDSPGTGDQAE